MTVREFLQDDAPGLAAQLAYYLILALFPFILALVSLMGIFGSEDLAASVLGYFSQIVPGQVYELIERYLRGIIEGKEKAPGLLSFGILFTIWTGSNAFFALTKALNRAYDVQETRPFWKVRGITVLMTLGLSVLVLAGVLLLVLGEPIGRTVAGIFGLREVFLFVWNIARWPVALLFLVITVALLYYFAPDADQPFRWITPGGLIGVLLWVLASVAFSLYVNNFGSYNKSLRLYRRRHRPAALPVYLLAHHTLRRHPQRHPAPDERGGLRPADPRRRAREHEAQNSGRRRDGESMEDDESLSR